MVKCVFVQGTKTILCSGALDRMVDIMTRDQTFGNFDDEVDYDIETAVLTDVPAQIQTPTPVEVFNGVNKAGVSTHLFTIRYIDGIDVTNSVRYNGKYYNILGIINVEERNEWLALQCSERGNTSKPANLS